MPALPAFPSRRPEPFPSGRRRGCFFLLKAPFSKLLLGTISSTILAALLYLGAAKTSAYYAVAPFIGVLFSIVVEQAIPPLIFWVALVVMLAGTAFASADAGSASGASTA